MRFSTDWTNLDSPSTFNSKNGLAGSGDGDIGEPSFLNGTVYGLARRPHRVYSSIHRCIVFVRGLEVAVSSDGHAVMRLQQCFSAVAHEVTTTGHMHHMIYHV